MDILLIMGCNGFSSTGGFHYCHSVNNPILNVSKQEELDKILQFLDKTCELFDRPCADYNKCMNIVSMLFRDFKVIPQETLHNIQAFSRQHKTCGIYLALVLSEDYYG